MARVSARAIALAHRSEPTLDLSIKSDPAGWAERLGGIVLPTGSVRLDSHVPVAELEGYADGEWWVQDAAAALPARLLRPAPGMRIVDLCAAPGGKAAELAAAGADLTAVDRSAERLKLLAANFARLRLHSEVVVADALTFEAPPFDAVLLDAPCSATGTIRRHPDVAWIKRSGDVAPLVKLQAELLDKAIKLARPGGAIVYCVCSLEPEEGETQIAAVLRRNPDVRRSAVTSEEVGGLVECVTPSGDLRTCPATCGATIRAAQASMGFSPRGWSRRVGRSLEKGKWALPVLAQPLGAVLRLVLGLVVEVPLALFWRERLGRDHRSPADAAPGRRIALLGESRAGRKGEGNGKSEERSSFEHRFFPIADGLFQNIPWNARENVRSNITPHG